MDGLQVFLIAFMASSVTFVIGIKSGESKMENYYQKLLIEKYDATYCDGKFSLEKCDE